MAKKIVINNDMVQQTKSHIVNLFKPPFNPFLDRSTTAVTNLFALQQYDYEKTKNPIRTHYNDKNIITNLFLCTEDFLNFMNKINGIWAADTLPRVMTTFNYVKNANGWIKVDENSYDTTAYDIVAPLVNGPTGNIGGHIKEFESAAKAGMWGNQVPSRDGIGSCSIQEIMLRHLYSLNDEKRKVAFQIAELYYRISNSECNAANLGFIPAKDFNSDLMNVVADKDEFTFSYDSPIEFVTHYDETIHNPNNKKLYLYFPYITSNAMRPRYIGEDTNNFDGLISVYTGAVNQTNVVTSLQVASFTPANAPFFNAANNETNASFVWRDYAVGESYGTLTYNENMPVLTNSIWSAKSNKFVNQAGYTVIQISETGDGGDITFDHTDKIDFIDSLKFIIKAPTVFA